MFSSPTRPPARRAAALALALSVALASAAAAQAPPAETRRDVGNFGEEAARHHSFVTDARGNIVATDAQYARDIARHFTGGAVDVVMQQCFGGGFLNDIKTGVRTPRTFASASAWNQCAQGTKRLGNGGAGPITLLENFTRPWTKHAEVFPNGTMLDHFRLAANDGVAANTIPKDRFAPPTSSPDGRVENPQFYSPDPLNAAGTGPNNSRTIAPPQGGNRYAILVSWDKPLDANPLRDDFAVGIARMNQLLHAQNGLAAAGINPLRNIVTLYHDTPRNTNVGPFAKVRGDGNAAGDDLRSFFVDGTNSRQNWLDALAGKLFVNANDQLGVTYGPNDQLLIYNTGHGGHENTVAPAVVRADGLRYDVALGDAFVTAPVDAEVAHNFTEPDGRDLLQISTRRPVLDPLVELFLNGRSFGSLGSYLVDDMLAYGLGDFVTGRTYTYHVPVEHAFLGLSPSSLGIDLRNPNGRSLSPDLVAAFRLRGGAQDYLATVSAVPEPGTLTLFAGGLLALAARARARLAKSRARR